MNDLKWFRTSGASHFECQVEVKLLQYQRLQPGDLVVLSLERACRPISLQGILLKAKGTNQMQAVEDGKKSFIVQVELSKISELSRQAQDFSLDGASTWRLHFILIPPNEKKCIQLLQDMPRSCPLQGMRLTIPRSTKEIKREMEMRPLVSISEARMCHKPIHDNSNPSNNEPVVPFFEYSACPPLVGDACNALDLQKQAEWKADVGHSEGPAEAVLNGSRASRDGQDLHARSVRCCSLDSLKTALERQVWRKTHALFDP